MSFTAKLHYNLVVIYAVGNCAEVEGKIYPLIKLGNGHQNFGLCGPCIWAKQAVLQFDGRFWKQQAGIIVRRREINLHIKSVADIQIHPVIKDKLRICPFKSSRTVVIGNMVRRI